MTHCPPPHPPALPLLLLQSPELIWSRRGPRIMSPRTCTGVAHTGGGGGGGEWAHEHQLESAAASGERCEQGREKKEKKRQEKSGVCVGECEYERESVCARVCLCVCICGVYFFFSIIFFCSCDSWDEGVEAARVIGGGVNRASVSLFAAAPKRVCLLVCLSARLPVCPPVCPRCRLYTSACICVCVPSPPNSLPAKRSDLCFLLCFLVV